MSAQVEKTRFKQNFTPNGQGLPSKSQKQCIFVKFRPKSACLRCLHLEADELSAGSAGTKCAETWLAQGSNLTLHQTDVNCPKKVKNSVLLP